MYFLSVFAYPAICVLLLAGVGGVVFKVSGARVSWSMLLPLGLSGLVVVGQLLAWIGLNSPFNLLLVVALAVFGLVSLIRSTSTDGDRRSMVMPALAGFVAFGMTIAPVALAGRATLAGFLLDTSSGVQMLGADHLLHHGADFSHVSRAATSDALLLRYFVDATYPYGSHIALALTGGLSGLSLIWIYSPFMAVMAGVTATGLFGLARRLGLSPAWSVVSAIAAAVPALVYAYCLQGSIKEVVFAPCLIAAISVMFESETRSSIRALAVNGGIAIAGLFSVIGLGAAAWAAFIGAGYVLLRSRHESAGRGRTILFGAAALTVSVAVMLLPKLTQLNAEFKLARSLSQTNTALAADPGNLLQPIGKNQSVGVWLGGSHRTAPRWVATTNAFIAVGAALVLLGLLAFIRERNGVALLWLTGTVAVWLALTARGTVWLDAKLVMLSSYAVVLTMFAGASRMRLSRGHGASDAGGPGRLPAVLAISAFALAIVASDALQYRATGILPTDRYTELERINAKFAKDGPGYIPDFDEYALYMLRDIHVSGPGNVDPAATTGRLSDGSPVRYGNSIDPDHAYHRDFTDLNLVISRRGPWRSNPGPQFTPVFFGRFYDVWRRAKDMNEIEHLSLGEDVNVGIPTCADVARLKARAARQHARLKAGVGTAPVRQIERTQIVFQGRWADQARPSGNLSGSGTMSFTATIEPGQSLWWEGNIDRPVTIKSNGVTIGRIGRESGGIGNTIGPVSLPTGSQTITISRGRGTLFPGDVSSTVLDRLALAPARPPITRDVTNSSTATLCHQALDWLAITN